MSEFSALPKRETYPLVTSDDTLVIVFRDHLTLTALPSLFVKALVSGTQIRVDSGAIIDIDNFSAGGVVALGVQETTKIDLPVGAFVAINKVSALHVLSGRVSADLRSPVPVRTYFRQPTSLSGNTGHSGGAPVAPNPALP